MVLVCIDSTTPQDLNVSSCSQQQHQATHTLRLLSIILLELDESAPTVERAHDIRFLGSSSHPRRDYSQSTRRLPSPGERANGTGEILQYDNLPNIVQPAAVSRQGPAVDTPPERRRRDETPGSGQGERRRRQQPITPAAAMAAGSLAGRKTRQEEPIVETERMNPADLAAKKMLLPFINELSFIEIALEEVRGRAKLVA